MARITYGSLVSDISGSVGSATFQKSLYGNTLRSKPLPRRSSSPSQLGRRSLMVQLHNEWQALSPAQRNSWNQFISYSHGSIKRDAAILLTGHALFLKYNFLRVCSGVSTISDIVYSSISPVPTISKIEVDATHMYFYLTSDTTGLEIHFLLKLSAPRRPSLSFSKQGLRSIEIDSPGNISWGIHSTYLDIFGALTEVGDYLHYSIQWFSLLSPICLNPRTGIIICTSTP